jgi:hypothetical protein
LRVAIDSVLDAILDEAGCIAPKPPPAPSFAPVAERSVVVERLPPSAAGNIGGGWGRNLRGLAECQAAIAALQERIQPGDGAKEPARVAAVPAVRARGRHEPEGAQAVRPERAMGSRRRAAPAKRNSRRAKLV